MSDYSTKINSDKTEAVSSLQEAFSRSTDFFFADYRGMTVEQMTALRDELRKKKASFRVVKNRYAKIAFEQLKKPEAVAAYLVGPTAITIVEGEPGATAKVLYELAKEMPLDIKGGLVGDEIYDSKQLEAFSKLPTKDEIIAMFMAALKAPVQSLAYLLQAIADKKAEGSDTAAAAAEPAEAPAAAESAAAEPAEAPAEGTADTPQ